MANKKVGKQTSVQVLDENGNNCLMASFSGQSIWLSWHKK